MNDDDMITIRNKRTGEVKTVPRSKFVEEEPSTGFSGVGNDVMSSLASAPEAAVKMIKSIPGGAKNVYNYATSNNPVETLGNLGAGGVESGAGLFSAAPKLARYIAEKFPGYGELLNRGRALNGQKSIQETPTIYERLMNFEKNHGMGAQSKEEQSVRNLGGLLFGGKALSRLPNVGSRVAALAAQQGGEGGDPLHAAILGLLGEGTLNGLKSIPKIPKTAGSLLGTALQNSADYVSAIPGAGKVIAPIAQPILGMTGAKLKYASTDPETMARENLFGDITKEDLPAMQERNAAAKRMGINPTVAELTNDAYEAAKQGEIGKTKEGQKSLYKEGEISDAAQEKAINELFDMIHEDKLEPAKKAAYEDTMAREVPQEFIDKHIQNPAIEKAMNVVKNNTAFKQLLYDEYGVSDVDKVPKNSFMYWDFVKRALHEIESKAGRKGGKTEPAVFSRIRNKMVNDLDNIAPKYKEARNIAERGFTRNDLEKVFDKKAKNFNNFDSYLKSKENFDALTRKLQAFPEALQRLNDIKMFSGKMIPNNPGVRAAAALKRTSMSEPRNYLAAKHLRQLQKYGENHDVAAVKQMTHPDLMKHLSEYLKEKGKL